MLAAAALLLLALAAPALANAQGAARTCRGGLVVDRGEGCTYPGTVDEFTVDASGRGRFLVFTSERRVEIGATTINGVVYDFAASAQGDGTWLVETAGGAGAPSSPVTAPTPPAAPGSLDAAGGAALEGRILARRLGSGAVEFGFQPEGGELILPDRRFFPASARVDRWLLSSDVVSAGDVLGRITARLLADGRIEFGFTPAEGERILPRVRFFPATAAVGRWLRSSIVDVRPPRAAQGSAPAPDLVVETPTVSESAPTAGKRLSLRATVRNRGSERSDSTRLRYILSPDASIPTADAELASDYVSRLRASGSGPEWVYLTAPEAPGTYYLGACVEAVPGEADTTNNCSQAVAIAVGAAPTPDLVVETPAVSESAPAAGERLRLRATVRNQGTGRSDSTTLRYYQSPDASISAADTELESDYVSRLSASGSGPEWVYLTAPEAPGTYYYGACVDAVPDEADTTNNCSQAVAVAVGAAPAPDLVVDAPTVSEHAPAAGARFRLNATVRNQGTGRSESTTLRYYQSPDASISAADTELESDYVSRLSASRSGAEWAYLTAPAAAETYYYGACVEPVANELDTTNNCSAAVAVTVGGAPAPDLVVDAPTVSERAPAAGASLRLNATVRNQGTGRSDATTLRYYLSTDAVITAGDTELGTDAVSALSPSRAGSEDTGVTAPEAAGAYYYGACVEAVPRELDTSNNCSQAVAVTVGSAPAPAAAATRDREALVALYHATDGPGWRHSDDWLSDEPAGAWYGVTTNAAGRVVRLDLTNNQLSGELPAELGRLSELKWLLLSYNELDGELPAELGRLSSLVTLRITRSQLSGQIPSELGQLASLEGLYLNFNALGGEIPAGLGRLSGLEELDLSWNALGGEIPAALGGLSGLEKLDLSDNDLSGTIPAELAQISGLEELDLSDNDLDGAIPPALGRLAKLEELHLSDNALSGEIPAELGRLANLDLLYLFGNDLSGEIPAELGRLSDLTYLYLARNALSGCVPEALRAVQWNDFGRLGLPFCGAVPDLVVEPPTVSESAPAAGARFTLHATVRNQGASRSDSTRLRYYRSTDGTITTGDTEVGSDFVSRLAASAGGAESIALEAPQAAGTYYYGACVEAVPGEADTTNNCSAAVAVTVGSGPAPDLVVETPTVSESAPDAGERLTLRATVRNRGSGRSDSTTLRYYLSTDASITAGDTAVGTDPVSALSPSRTGAESTGVIAPSAAGTYYYGACVDAVPGEKDATNNCSAAVAVTVGSPAATFPDPPTGLRATANGETRIDLSWTAPESDGGAAITGYRIESSADGSTWSDLAADTGSTVTSYDHTGLTAGTTRHYRVSTINSVGTSLASSTVSATTDAAQPTFPDPPTSVTATANGESRIDLSWTAPESDGGAAITGYRIESSADGSSWSDLVADTGSTVTSYDHTGLTAGSTRHYRISAINSVGTSLASSTVSAATDSAPAATAPGAPTGLTATASGQTRIDLSWTAPASSGGAAITGYRIEVSTDGSSWSDLAADTGSTVAGYNHAGLTAGSTRYYRVSAINSAGTGSASGSANATTEEKPASDGTCSVGDVVAPGESCAYPGTSVEFSVDATGTGRFLFSSSGTRLVLRNTTINGVSYTFVASKQDDGSWRVEEVG